LLKQEQGKLMGALFGKWASKSYSLLSVVTDAFESLMVTWTEHKHISLYGTSDTFKNFITLTFTLTVGWKTEWFLRLMMFSKILVNFIDSSGTYWPL
jgi:hypothetical protein